jgi:hypothetical protein
LDERTRKCVERASSRPPPRATDEIAEIVGTGSEAREPNVARRLVRNSLVLVGEKSALGCHGNCLPSVGLTRPW